MPRKSSWPPRIWWAGRWHYLGPPGSEQSRLAYAELLRRIGAGELAAAPGPRRARTQRQSSHPGLIRATGVVSTARPTSFVCPLASSPPSPPTERAFARPLLLCPRRVGHTGRRSGGSRARWRVVREPPGRPGLLLSVTAIAYYHLLMECAYDEELEPAIRGITAHNPDLQEALA